MRTRITTAIALVCLLMVPMTSAQSSELPTRSADECTNNGVIIQASGGTSTINCKGDCTNNGIVVQAATSSAYTCDGACTNNGIIVWGPRADGHTSGCGDGPYQHLGGACAGDFCILPHICDPEVCDPRILDELLESTDVRSDIPWLKICQVNVVDSEIVCAHSDQCAIMQNPGCWTLRLGCTLAHNQTRVPEILERYGIHCQPWDSFASSAPI